MKNFLIKIKNHNHILTPQTIRQKTEHCQPTITFSVHIKSEVIVAKG